MIRHYFNIETNNPTVSLCGDPIIAEKSVVRMDLNNVNCSRCLGMMAAKSLAQDEERCRRFPTGWLCTTDCDDPAHNEFLEPEKLYLVGGCGEVFDDMKIAYDHVSGDNPCEECCMVGGAYHVVTESEAF